jgi:secernin
VCDTLVSVTRRGVLFAKNSDRDPNEGQALEWRPRALHAPGSTVRCTWIDVPQVPETYATLQSRPFWGFGAEIGTNEHGVTIGNEAIFATRSVPEVGLTGMDLLRLALERARTARRALDVIRELAARHGQGGRCGHEDPGFRYFSSFLVADPAEAWVLETVGADSEVERVTGPRSISNGLTIAKLLPRRDRLRTWFAAARARRAETESAAARASDPADLARVLRSHGGDSVAPRYALHHGAMRAPCMHAGGLVASSQTTASWISELSATRPRHFVTATAAPCTSIFKPVAVDSPLDLGPTPGALADDSFFWRHERLHRAALRAPARWLPRLDESRRTLEARCFAGELDSQAAFDAHALWLEQRTAELGRPDDERPRWVRRFWSIRDRRAGLA